MKGVRVSVNKCEYIVGERNRKVIFSFEEHSESIFGIFTGAMLMIVSLQFVRIYRYSSCALSITTFQMCVLGHGSADIITN